MNESNTSKLEHYTGHIIEIQDDRLSISDIRIESMLKSAFEKGQQSIASPAISWLDALSGAFVSSIVSCLTFFLIGEEKNGFLVAINILIPCILLVAVLFTFQKRQAENAKQKTNTAIRDAEVKKLMAPYQKHLSRRR